MRSVPHVLSLLVLVCLKGLASGDEPHLELVLQTGHRYDVENVALSGDGNLVVTSGSLDGRAILWDRASGKTLRTFQGHTDAVTSVALSRDGKHILTGSYDKTAILW